MARVSAEAKARKAAYDRAYRAQNNARIRARIDAYALEHKADKAAYDRARREGPDGEALRSQKRSHHHANRARLIAEMRRRYISRTYSIQLEDKAAMLWAQGGVCSICRRDLDADDRNTHLDHDHATGRLRGVLCHGCNVGLGAFRDDPDRMRRAIAYLRANSQDLDVLPMAVDHSEG